jgi:hypothetical protein
MSQVEPGRIALRSIVKAAFSSGRQLPFAGRVYVIEVIPPSTCKASVSHPTGAERGVMKVYGGLLKRSTATATCGAMKR